MSTVTDTSIANNTPVLDMIIIGGGINGAGIAADASGRGLNIGLYEQNDFACATSSASSKLIHGGLRYLEHYEFRLVSESLAEREVLLRKLPHIAFPMRFRLPHRPFLRPAWMIRLGLFLYDHLSKRSTLQSSKKIELTANLFVPEITTAFEYSDCWVDDARLVMLNILAAKENQAEVRNYCKVENAIRKDDLWHVTILDTKTNQRFVRKAKALINATGPWIKTFFDQSLEQNSPRNIRLIKGSHIVVPRIHDQEQAYILQNQDKRIVFIIPYLEKFSLIGTTDVEFKASPEEAAISDEEIEYLINIVNQHFVNKIKKEDIVWSFSGVRPLCDDNSSSAQSVTRDYSLELDSHSTAPLLSIFGGKLTTYRKLAESALLKLSEHFPNMGKNWTAYKPLPGGDFSCSHDQLVNKLSVYYPKLSKALLLRYVKQYGTITWKILDDVNEIMDLGMQFSTQAEGIYQREIDYLIRDEMATNLDDILWRRTKLGLFIKEDEKQSLEEYILSKQ